ncbi:sortase [Candidatus Saccharibacteria bacterium]|nr:sortase [Candidatus Saccharibacteria bacterium]
MTRFGSKLRLYILIGMLDLAVGVMFYVVNIRPEPPVIASNIPVVTRQAPLAPRMIPAITGIPNRIVLQSLDIDLSVDVGSYNPTDNSWTIGTTRAYYADPSLPANNSNGRTLIYGHAQPQVFGRLPEIQLDAEALVYTDSGYLFHYKYKAMTAVVPTDTSVFDANGPPTLVLQTCTGDWDAYRALFSFTFESVEKI